MLLRSFQMGRDHAIVALSTVALSVLTLWIFLLFPGYALVFFSLWSAATQISQHLSEAWLACWSTSREATAGRWCLFIVVPASLIGLFVGSIAFGFFSALSWSIRLYSGMYLLFIWFDLQTGARMEDWQNPRVFHRNRLPMHVPLGYFPDRESALQCVPCQGNSPRLLSLDGQWSFFFTPSVHNKVDMN